MTTGSGSIEGVIDILLVEPNPGDTRLFTENFRDANLLNTVHTVSDGDAALDFLRQRGEYADAPRPDIVLLEPQLPGTTGMDVLADLDGDPVLSEIPVAVLTSSRMGEEIVRSHDLEADFYVRKPVEPEDFATFVREIEEFWFAIVREPSET